MIQENLNYNDSVRALADSGGRALNPIIAGTRILKNIGFKTYTKLFKAGVF